MCIQLQGHDQYQLVVGPSHLDNYVPSSCSTQPCTWQPPERAAVAASDTAFAGLLCCELCRCPASSLGHTQRLCCPMEDVRPVASSCPCLNTLERAKPRPSSRMDRVRTPTMVDLPESTLPMTATRISMELAPSSALGCLRARMSALSPPARRHSSLDITAHACAHGCVVTAASLQRCC